MPEKDAPFLIEALKTALPYLWALLLSAWGGAVSYVNRIRKRSKPFNWKELAFDLITSSFAGILAYSFCQYSKIDGYMSVILIATSGHMGTRAIASFENLYNRIVGVSKNEET